MSDTLLKNTAETRSRIPSLDLLRVVSMLMIILWHCLIHGGIITSYDTSPDKMTLEFFSMILLMSFLSIHVNCFVLASGYFLCKSEFKLSRAIKLWAEALFWSVLFYIVMHYVDPDNFEITKREFFRSALPFTHDRYWFFTTYILMYILSPFCNLAIRAMSKRQHLVCIFSFFFIFIFLDGGIFWRQFTGLNFDNVLYFMFLYFTSAYFRLYPPKKRPWWIGYIVSMAAAAIYITRLPELFLSLIEKEVNIHPYVPYNSSLCVIGSICFFLTFLQMNVKGIIAKISVFLSPLTFGIYLIHEQSDVRKYLWHILLEPRTYMDSEWFFPAILIMCFGIFIVCACLEKVRMLLFKHLYIDKLLEIFSSVLQKCLRGTVNILQKVF